MYNRLYQTKSPLLEFALLLLRQWRRASAASPPCEPGVRVVAHPSPRALRTSEKPNLDTLALTLTYQVRDLTAGVQSVVGFKPAFDSARIKAIGGLDNERIHLFFLKQRIKRIGELDFATRSWLRAL